jgi:nucleoside-diphosphate-sugar epimerase
VKEAVRGADAVIHLACISNDPSVELDPDLSKSVNLDSFGPTVKAAKEAGVGRFIFASSGSVYGVSDSPQVTEDHPLVPVSLYNKYKAACEPLLFAEQSPTFTTVAVRPATICGYSPRQRLDLTVNILTNHAVNNGKITVFGGVQMRPNLHMQDMVDLYCLLLEVPDEKIAGQIFNAGYQNYSVAETAEVVRKVVQEELPEKGAIEIVTTPSDDIRSYRINSDKIQRVLGFVPRHTIEDGARDLIRAFKAGKLPDSMSDTRYSNIKTMKAVHLK